ncbi:hypothetical protein PMIN07_002632 [Paraphaeosphaeria minitans]
MFTRERTALPILAVGSSYTLTSCGRPRLLPSLQCFLEACHLGSGPRSDFYDPLPRATAAWTADMALRIYSTRLLLLLTPRPYSFRSLLMAQSLTASGPGSHSSTGTVERDRRASDTSNDDGGQDVAKAPDERGRSTTPTPYSPQSYTPSHHSQQTEEEHGEGRGPLSSNPWSANFPYNAQQRERTEAIDDVDIHFPVDQQPRAEHAYREEEVRSRGQGPGP